jgi:hypothetical protein
VRNVEWCETAVEMETGTTVNRLGRRDETQSSYIQGICQIQTGLEACGGLPPCGRLGSHPTHRPQLSNCAGELQPVTSLGEGDSHSNRDGRMNEHSILVGLTSITAVSPF